MVSDTTAATIAVVSLALQAPTLLPGIFQTLKVFKETLHIGGTSSRIQNQLQTAQENLAAWVFASGWSSGKLKGSMKHNENSIGDTIADIYRTYKKLRDISRTYGIELPGVPESIDLGRQWRLPNPYNGIVSPPKLLTDLVIDLGKRESQFTKSHWKLDIKPYRFASIDGPALESLVANVSALVDRLIQILPEDLKIEHRTLLRENEVLRIEEYRKKSIASLCELRDIATGNGQVDTAADLIHEIASRSPTQLPLNTNREATLTLSRQAGSAGRRTGKVKWSREQAEVKVLLELRRVVPDQVQKQALQNGYMALCQMLYTNESQHHREMRVLKSCGFRIQEAPTDVTAEVQGQECFYLAYDWPAGYSSDDPSNLYALLKDSTFKPPLEHRLDLALQLVKTIFRFGAYGFLHKAIRSSNVIFFQKENTADDQTRVPGKKDIHSPFICGFEFSRHTESTNLTLMHNLDDPSETARHDLYRHPFCQGGIMEAGRGRYGLKQDLFSLGIVLCEIGRWAAIDSRDFWKVSISRAWTVDHAKEKRSIQLAMPQDDPEAHKYPVFTLAHRMGSEYQRAVLNCLSDNHGSDERQWIVEQVLKPMERACRLLGGF